VGCFALVRAGFGQGCGSSVDSMRGAGGWIAFASSFWLFGLVAGGLGSVVGPSASLRMTGCVAVAEALVGLGVRKWGDASISWRRQTIRAQTSLRRCELAGDAQ
jgi:hypothetical protein